MTNSKLKAVRFYFGDDPTFNGFTDGSTWNGFENVWVTKEVHDEIVKHFTNEYKLTGWEGKELTEALEHFNITPDADGLYSYANGFATSIDDDDDGSEDPIDVLTEVVNDWRDGLNLDDPDFSDKALQAQRRNQYDRAVIALNALRPTIDARCGQCHKGYSADRIGTVCQPCGGRGMIETLNHDGLKRFECFWNEGYVGGPERKTVNFDYFSDDLGFSELDRDEIADLAIDAVFTTGGPIETLTITRRI